MIRKLAVLLLSLSSSVFAMGGDDPFLTMVKFHELEWQSPVEPEAGDHRAIVFDMDAWAGRDLSKWWLKAEGEYLPGEDETEELSLQLLYGWATAPYWDVQVGIRHDRLPESRTWFALGVQGLATNFREVDATLYVSEKGIIGATLEMEMEILFTQRLHLIPLLEASAYSRADEELGIGQGINEVELGLRLAYEIEREFAPYVGISWETALGDTRQRYHHKDEAHLVVGAKVWF